MWPVLVTRQPRGFGFVQFLEPRDAAEAQYCLDHQLIQGREITVVFAEENRKKPQEMRTKERIRGRPGFGGRRGSRSSYGRSRSRSPRRFSPSPRGGRRSRSLTPPARPARSPSPGRENNAPSRSPSAVRSHRRRTGERSPMPSRERSPALPRRSRDGEPRARELEPRSRDPELRARDVVPRTRVVEPHSRDIEPRARDVEPRARDIEPRARDAEPRMNGRDSNNARSRSRSPAGSPLTPPRRRRSPSPQARRGSPSSHRPHSRDAARDEFTASPTADVRRSRPSGGFSDQAPRSPVSS
ncbi:uncharacterized protein [Physcomitrium patens]|uniref:uncharacterized protein isoform X2 n=1 Tax=Physcomitrium patens TaxID=3218 RepID=UPI000D170A40|nr:serine/arginine-rich SC35-like splicing factor SCL30A isoform X2 [Physcomitrium patens]|eukprot:XP_024367966.1 serine/arginine-rich SC35-like splicing factor SCL30A isoform X2 [Physcomitrella patens]